MTWIVTGGAGFIGSCFARRALGAAWTDSVFVADALSYAGNLANLDAVAAHSGMLFKQLDVRDADAVEAGLPANASAIFHFAAEWYQEHRTWWEAIQKGEHRERTTLKGSTR